MGGEGPGEHSMTSHRASAACRRPRRSCRWPCCRPPGRPASPASAPARRPPASRPGATLPDGTTVPTEAIEAPASVSSPDSSPPGSRATRTRIVSSASTNGIPSAALAAYQRAETVINAADKTCNLSWQLVAAIGRVESDHGRSNGNTLNADGVATPGIYGIALDGSNGTAAITDTDAGQYDSDAKFDRAVGPMQFIPSTWSVVGVDADGDAQAQPAGHRRRRAGHRGLPLLRQRRPVRRGGPARRGLPLQPQRGLRRPRALDHERLPRRRLHLGARTPRPPRPATSSPTRPRPPRQRHGNGNGDGNGGGNNNGGNGGGSNGGGGDRRRRRRRRTRPTTRPPRSTATRRRRRHRPARPARRRRWRRRRRRRPRAPVEDVLTEAEAIAAVPRRGRSTTRSTSTRSTSASPTC